MGVLRVAFVVLCLLFLRTTPARAPVETTLHLLFATLDLERGSRFAEHLKSRNITVVVKKYGTITWTDLEPVDIVIADTPEGSRDEVLANLQTFAGIANPLPLSHKPLVGIGTLGYRILGQSRIALGSGYT